MATRDQHLAQAAENASFVQVLRTGQPQYYAWAITAMFYSAVHYGRAFLASRQVLITSHQQFATHFLRVTNDAGLYAHYRHLKDASERGRYDCVAYSLTEIDALETQHFIPFRTALALALALAPASRIP